MFSDNSCQTDDSIESVFKSEIDSILQKFKEAKKELAFKAQKQAKVEEDYNVLVVKYSLASSELMTLKNEYDQLKLVQNVD